MVISPLQPESITLLHVDDEPSFTSLTKTFLQRIDPELTVLEAHDGDEATALMQSESVDCVISDYDMPGQNGIELLELVRERYGELPFILLTGRGSEEIASKAISANVSGYLQKSGNQEQYELLANRIQSLTAKHRTESYVQQIYEALDIVGEGVSLLNGNGEYLYTNERYASIFGYTPDELIGRHWETIYRNEEDSERMREEVLSTLEPGGTWNDTTRQARKDGSVVVVDHTLAYTSERLLVCLVSEVEEPSVTDDGLNIEAE